MKMEDTKNGDNELTNPMINGEEIVNQCECLNERESREANFYFDERGKN